MAIQLQLRLTPDGNAMQGYDQHGNELRMALPELAGGDDTGIRPMQLMIFSLGGCAAVDVLNILKKQRQQLTGLEISIDAARFERPLPNPWEKAHIVFTLYGRVEQGKAEKAVALSLEKYCSAAETLRLAGATITWEVRVVETNSL